MLLLAIVALNLPILRDSLIKSELFSTSLMRAMTVNKCPVCDMDVMGLPITVDHTGITYYLCSQQCQENFLARPKLYIGLHAARRAGKVIIKRRTLFLDKPVEGSKVFQLTNALQHMMGVREVLVNGKAVSITYDLLEVTAEQLERAISDVGETLGSGWSARLKHGWVHYTEENELNNLASDTASCCSKAPKKA